MGVDLGKVHDPTAICIVEYVPIKIAETGAWWHENDTDPAHDWTQTQPDTLYLVRSIDRLALGTSYPEISRRIVGMCRKLRGRYAHADIHLLMDNTGVGRGPVDQVRELLDPAILLTGISITGSDKCDPSPLYKPEASCGKAFMVIRAQTVLQKRLLQMPKGPMVHELVSELSTFEVRTSITGYDRYAAFTVGTHDDLVIALCLSILGDAHTQGVRYSTPGLYG